MLLETDYIENLQVLACGLATFLFLVGAKTQDNINLYGAAASSLLASLIPIVVLWRKLILEELLDVDQSAFLLAKILFGSFVLCIVFASSILLITQYLKGLPRSTSTFKAFGLYLIAIVLMAIGELIENGQLGTPAVVALWDLLQLSGCALFAITAFLRIFWIERKAKHSGLIEIKQPFHSM